jgi:5,5'-dehydrodivanillate O-demethylase
VIVTDPVEVLPCTFWNKMDNDPNHIPWVHRATALRKGRNDFLKRQQGTVEETPYGIKTIRHLKGEADDAMGIGSFNRFFMPNVRQFWPKTRAKGFEGRQLWDTKTVWTVPINDAKCTSFDVTHTPLVGEEARLYQKNRYEQQEAEAETRWDLAEKVLAGEMTLEDMPDDMGAYTSFAIEDYTTQVGQGPIAGRGVETLSTNDSKPLLIRRLWLREVTAMLEGKPMKDWQVPPSPRDANTTM